MNTGIRMFDHLLEQLAQHGVFDLKISSVGSDTHHVVEDVAICLGRAFNQALGERQGIMRMAHALVPMDDALALVAIDIGGRGYGVVDLSLVKESIGDLPTELVGHFFDSLAREARLNLHAKVLYGINDHHKAEASFKALGRALDIASQIDERRSDITPSTKGIIDP
jgi:imidazoleglycerol-phosphate dehydratase